MVSTVTQKPVVVTALQEFGFSSCLPLAPCNMHIIYKKGKSEVRFRWDVHIHVFPCVALYYSEAGLCCRASQRREMSESARKVVVICVCRQTLLHIVLASLVC